MPHSYGHELAFAVSGGFLFGSWFNLNSANFGCAQFQIQSANDRMIGLHTGNTSDNRIEAGNWAWIKLCHSDAVHDTVQATNRMRLKDAVVLENQFASLYQSGGLVNIMRVMK